LTLIRAMNGAKHAMGFAVMGEYEVSRLDSLDGNESGISPSPTLPAGSSGISPSPTLPACGEGVRARVISPRERRARPIN